METGVDVLTHSDGGKNGGVSVADYAREKRLPVDFLMQLGLCDQKGKGAGASIRIPYLDETGREAAVRYRIALSGHDRFRWAKGSKLLPYGLWRLDRSAGYVILVEGESDAHTLWYHDLPALGIPGASTWKPEWQRYLEGLRVYVWQEPDGGGATLVESLARSTVGCLVMRPGGRAGLPAGRKDASECHVAGDDVRAVIEDMMAQAQPAAALLNQVAEEEAAAAGSAARAAAGDLPSSADILGEFGRLCAGQGLVGENRIAKLLFLALTSRLQAKPVSVVVKGPASGGKSYTVETVLRAFPPTAYYALSSMSERALAYSEEPLKHRMLVLCEAAGMTGDFATYLIRTLLSEGCIRYETVERTSEGLRPKLIEREGPTGLIVTTTAAGLHPENETRMLSVTVADDRSQTAGVLLSLAGRANGHRPPEPDYTSWHGLQSWLELAGAREVSIPYAHELALLADCRAVRLRRDFGAVLTLIATHAMLHQETRGRDAIGRVVASLADYRGVYDLVIDSINQGVQATVSAAERELVDAVTELDGDPRTSPVSVTRLAERLDIDKAAASRRARVALEDGYITNLEDKRGKPFKLKPGEPLPEERMVLPDPNMVEEAWAHGGIPSTNMSTGQQ